MPILSLLLLAAAGAAAAVPQDGIGSILATFALLVGLELVLGIDNVVVIAILVQRLPEKMRNRARIIGLTLAVVCRMLALFLIMWLGKMTEEIFLGLSVRDMILLAGGLYLLKQAVKEIHHVVEMKDEHHAPAVEDPVVPEASLAKQPAATSVKATSVKSAFRNAILQIVVLDIVFSLDSVITAVGLTDVVWVIIAAVLVSFGAVLAYARQVGEFILAHPTLKILALSFLVTIGVTLVMEGLGAHVPKGYIYLPMAFALAVEMLQMRFEHNRKRNTPPDGGAPTAAH